MSVEAKYTFKVHGFRENYEFYENSADLINRSNFTAVVLFTFFFPAFCASPNDRMLVSDRGRLVHPEARADSPQIARGRELLGEIIRLAADSDVPFHESRSRVTPASPSRRSGIRGVPFVASPSNLASEHVARYSVSNRENAPCKIGVSFLPLRGTCVLRVCREAEFIDEFIREADICVRRFERTSHLLSRCAVIVFTDAKRKHRMTRQYRNDVVSMFLRPTACLRKHIHVTYSLR